jgi:hypothetical protein
MTQLVLSAAQTGSSLVATGGSTAAQSIASTVANVAANYALSQAQSLIYGPQKRRVTDPRIESFRLQASTEGTPIPRLYGRSRLAGQVIWASRFREEESTITQSSGGKGSRPRVETTTTEYLYSISLAIGLCEGEIDRIARVWADGKAVQLQDYTWRLYKGDDAQLPDSVIEAVEGAGNAPAYRGLAYIVFEDLPLKKFGNRIPQFTFEIERSLRQVEPTALENAVTAVTMIPSAGEAIYGTTPVVTSDGEGTSRTENTHTTFAETDFLASTDILGDTLPNCRHVALIISWFGTDLRAGFCELHPGVEVRDKTTLPYDWAVAGESRATAHLVSTVDGTPAFGGTPSDTSVIEAIKHLKAQGFEVLFYPFILMDIPADNQLPDLDGSVGQPAFPWRGRIGAGLNDGMAAARIQVQLFFGTAQDNGMRRMILHYAYLCAQAGGVSSFLLGSELRGLTTIRDDTGAYPAVAEFKTLASEVRAILGSETDISYAADWSEYFGHQPPDGSGDVRFHLDDLWADANIDFIGIDNYMPLADWRDGATHLDTQNGAKSIYDISYLQSNIEGGEGYDWYYASQQDREAQNRSPITDGAYGEDWIFRYKDIRQWWENTHYDRVAGVKQSQPTAWQAQMKPVRFTELGCAAVDKAANQPNVFVDPKSAENALPYFSNARRDDMIQRRFIEAHLSYWRLSENNPVSSVYNEKMIDMDRVYIYTWDARPYPLFPALEDVWADGNNWRQGHWLTGRVGRMPLDMLVRDIAEQSGLPQVDVSALQGLVTGFVLDRPMSAREALEPLAGLYQFDVVESGDVLRFVPRGQELALRVTCDELVVETDEPFQLIKAQAEDLPTALDLVYINEGAAYDPAVAEARRPDVQGLRTVTLNAPVVMEADEAEGRVQGLLVDALVMGETGGFRLPPSLMAVEPTDIVELELGEEARQFRVLDILDQEARELSVVTTYPGIYDQQYGAPRAYQVATPVVYGPPVAEILDLPLLTEEGESALYAAAFANPWPGGVSIYREEQGATTALEAVIAAPATIGTLQEALAPGVAHRWDKASTVTVRVPHGQLQSRSETDVLNGANLLAVETEAAGWELVSFLNAELVAENIWRLSGLLRGQSGTETAAHAGSFAGARIILMNENVLPLPFQLSDRFVDISRALGPQDELVGTRNFVSISGNYTGTGWRPLSPVHVRVQYAGDTYEISWVRRTRINGDVWEVTEVPLEEDEELYQIEIREDGALIETVTVPTPAYTYTPSIGAAEAELRIAQVSAIYGRGEVTVFTLQLL